MHTTLPCPPALDHGLGQRTWDVVLDGRPVTIGFAPIAPARSVWFPTERILILDGGPR